MGFARRLVAGDASGIECIYFRELGRDVKKLEEVGKKASISVYSAGTDEKISFIKPCLQDTKKYMGETRFTLPADMKYGFFDVISQSLFLSLRVECEAKSSPKLGVSRVNFHDGRNSLIFDSGEVAVREAGSEDNIRSTLHFLSRVLWGAVICPNCGNCLYECLLSCMNPPLGPPVFEPGNNKPVFTPLRILEEDLLPEKKLLNAIRGSLKNQLESIRKSPELNMKYFLETLNLSITYQLKVQDPNYAVLGLLSCGAAHQIKHAVDLGLGSTFNADSILDVKEDKEKMLARELEVASSVSSKERILDEIGVHHLLRNAKSKLRYIQGNEKYSPTNQDILREAYG